MYYFIHTYVLFYNFVFVNIIICFYNSKFYLWQKLKKVFVPQTKTQ